MTRRSRAFEIKYGDAAVQHLRDLDVRQRALVLDTVPRQLTHQPTVPTRNRKLLRANPLAPWELRIGDLRVYFDVEAATVTIRAVGRKLREKVLIGGVEVDLT